MRSVLLGHVRFAPICIAKSLSRRDRLVSCLAQHMTVFSLFLGYRPSLFLERIWFIEERTTIDATEDSRERLIRDES